MAILPILGAVAAWGCALAVGVPSNRSAALAISVALAGAAVAALLLLAWHWWHGMRAATYELAETRRALTSLALTTHDVLWRVDGVGRIAWVTSGVEDLLGASRDVVVGRDVMDLIEPNQRALWSRQLREHVRLRRGWQDVPLRLQRPDCGVCLVETSAEPIVDRHGAVIGYEGTARAVSGARAERMRLAEQRELVSSLLTDERAPQIALQPIVSLVEGRVVGAEALTRFSSNPYLPPDVWFARASEVGLGVALEMQSLCAALRALQRLPDTLYLSLNVSPTTVVDPQFAALFDRPDVPCHRLVLEITEHESIADYARLITVLSAVRSRGVRLAVDDAGAGYASFRHILQLRPDHIKLDRDLTAGVDTDPARRALASAVVLFALELDSSVTAEGVETPAQLDVLRSLGVDAAQGFYLGTPSAEPSVWQKWRGLAPAALEHRSVG